MALPADFSKIYGSTATGGLTPINDVNYAKGWEFVGSNPPTKNDFSYLQNLSDLKSQWLYSNKLQRADPFGDIKSDGTVKTALANLGLGEGSALPVGVPVPWPSATPPTGWLKCNGAAFTSSQYPMLALAYPALRLPDLRGEFIRGWDDGHGVDAGRSLLSVQNDAIQNIVGTFGRTQLFEDEIAGGPFGPDGIIFSVGLSPAPANTGYGAKNWTFDASRAVRTSTETRSRNVAFTYIVRAE